MTYIETIPEGEATGKLKRQYDASLQRDRRVAGIIQALSLNENALDDLLRLNGTVAYGESGLSRAQREMIAIVVSKANGCRY